MEEKEVCYHVPVMLHESLEGLDIQPSGVYVDVTFGGGGHSREILNRLNDEGELYGFDQDADAEKNIPADSRFVFVRSNFRYLYNFMRYHGVAGEVDGVLAWWRCSVTMISAPCRFISTSKLAPIAARTARSPR